MNSRSLSFLTLALTLTRTSILEGAALNAVAFTGLRNPTILWTYGLSEDVKALDAYFQQHLLMDVYPMAPMPKNDHSILPGSAVVEQAYRDYAGLFDAMHGASWVLSPHPARIGASNISETTRAGVNVFMAGVGSAGYDYVVPVMVGNNDEDVTLTLNQNLGRKGPAAKLAYSVLYPGGEPPSRPVYANRTVHGNWDVNIRLRRGCALIRSKLSD